MTDEFRPISEKSRAELMVERQLRQLKAELRKAQDSQIILQERAIQMQRQIGDLGDVLAEILSDPGE